MGGVQPGPEEPLQSPAAIRLVVRLGWLALPHQNTWVLLGNPKSPPTFVTAAPAGHPILFISFFHFPILKMSSHSLDILPTESKVLETLGFHRERNSGRGQNDQAAMYLPFFLFVGTGAEAEHTPLSCWSSSSVHLLPSSALSLPCWNMFCSRPLCIQYDRLLCRHQIG